MFNVVYLSYGEGGYESEVLFSLMSAWRFGLPPSDEVRYVVYTDQPEAFADLPIYVRTVNSSEWAVWSGMYNYKHRRKILAMQDAFSNFDGACVLVDGDTFWHHNPTQLFIRIGRGRSIMHLREGRIDEICDPIAVKTGEILDKLQLSASSYIDALPCRHSYMWNAGIVGMDKSDVQLLDEILTCTDILCASSTGVHILEQLAFSHVLASKTSLSSADDIVFHYWSRRLRAQIRKHIETILSETSNLPLEKKILKCNSLPAIDVHLSNSCE